MHDDLGPEPDRLLVEGTCAGVDPLPVHRVEPVGVGAFPHEHDVDGPELRHDVGDQGREVVDVFVRGVRQVGDRQQERDRHPAVVEEQHPALPSQRPFDDGFDESDDVVVGADGFTDQAVEHLGVRHDSSVANRKPPPEARSGFCGEPLHEPSL
ncbi:hypothetical protein K0028_04255 [Curtobacterium flaccumfaciens pv. flaccumfaciens]|uniref:hypothetical protein n=1 Tax=Curtobacterium flaccumfaciens TaxID=2035 RepID=UPI0021B09DE5|nr:hypothetical protein [Curtobacterium flaccumfaciens]QYI98154.1 hypothetical protein K0028_04255 [Curtobacterium flaccumfaciens pv. flaccumfaciens]